MSTAKLDEPLAKKLGPVVWRTVEKDGKKYTLQVRLDTNKLEQIVAEEIDQMVSQQFRQSSVQGGIINVEITRAL